MNSQKCVVEGCTLEYDVICSFSFYNANICTDVDAARQEWIEGAMHEQSECLWRHVSLQLCGYHFELDNQGLWVDSPMLPELLTIKDKPLTVTQTSEDKKGSGRPSRGSFQGLYEKFIKFAPKAAENVHLDHNYCVEPPAKDPPENVSRLNVRQLVDTLGYLSMKNLQRKQLWVVKVETDKAEASITQSEQVITKMADKKQIVELIPNTSSSEQPTTEVLQIMEGSTIPDNFIYEIAEEQEISMEEVKEIPSDVNGPWLVNLLPDDTKPKYAYIKHCNTGKKKRHFTADMNEITLHSQGDFENYYILPDVDPSVGVEITTSYEPDNYIVEEYQHLVLDERPKKRIKDEQGKRKNKKRLSSGNPSKSTEDWVIQDDLNFDDSEDYDKKAASRVRRKNKKYLGYDFVT